VYAAIPLMVSAARKRAMRILLLILGFIIPTTMFCVLFIIYANICGLGRRLGSRLVLRRRASV
jgi:hypothetical protein